MSVLFLNTTLRVLNWFKGTELNSLQTLSGKPNLIYYIQFTVSADDNS